MAAGDLGTTATAVMMAAAYGKSVRVTYPAKSNRYICWAKSQMRYMLGDVGYGFVVGFGVRNSQYPTHVQDRSASCPNPPTPCNWINAYYNPKVRLPLAACCLACWLAVAFSHASPDGILRLGQGVSCLEELSKLPVTNADFFMCLVDAVKPAPVEGRAGARPCQWHGQLRGRALGQ